MQTTIIGAGAMGILFAARLAAAKLPVALFDINAEKVAHLNQSGIFLEELSGQVRHFQVPSFAKIQHCPPADLLLVLVKSYQTPRVLEDLQQALRPGLQVCSLQNGWGSAECLSRIVPAEQLLVGVCYQAARILAENRVQHTGNGLTTLGPLSAAGLPAAERVAALFEQADIQATAAADLSRLRWQKLLVNAAVNPLTALHRVRNGALLEQEALRQQMQAVLAEGVAVANASGQTLELEAVLAQTVRTCQATAANHSSMLSDIEAGRPTEIAAINGAIVDFGRQLGIATPCNSQLLAQVEALHPKAAKK